MVYSRRKAKLVGLGLDSDDDQTRITKGENFHLFGGSQETHHSMQEKCMMFNEKLNAKGKKLDDLEQQEFLDLAAECRMEVFQLRSDQS